MKRWNAATDPMAWSTRVVAWLVWLGLSSLTAVTIPPALAANPAPYELYQVTCLPPLDLFEFRVLDIWDLDLRGRVVNRQRPRLESRYTLYAPEWHVTVKGSRPNMESVSSIEPTRFECPLNAGLVELIVRPEPLWVGFGVSVTLSVAGAKIVRDLPFEACNITYPISRMIYQSGSRKLEFTGKFGAQRDRPSDPWDRFADTFRTFFVEDDFIRATNVEALGRARRSKPIRDFDVDYWGSGDFLEIGRMYDDCRYHGPGSAFAAEHGLFERRAK
jgi:hypothetical protein